VADDEKTLGAPGYDASPGAQPGGGVVENFAGILRWRRRLGYLLTALSSTAILGTLWYSGQGLSAIPQPTSHEGLYFEIARLAGHSIVAVATIYFFYQVFRVAERMMLPHWWVGRSMSKTMLGVSDPLTSLRKAVRLVLRANPTSEK
jgi:hypothetical protein